MPSRFPLIEKMRVDSLDFMSKQLEWNGSVFFLEIIILQQQQQCVDIRKGWRGRGIVIHVRYVNEV